MIRLRTLSSRAGLAGLLLLALSCPLRAAQPPVDFNRDIQPVLSEHCFACHGPDEQKRKAGLRLDTEEGALKELKSGDHAIVRGHLEKSTLVSRILSSDSEEIMPPPKGGKPLSKEQIELLRRWVEQGAPWQKHWSLVPPAKPPVPEVRDKKWPRNPVDHFIAERLQKEGLKPNPEADKTTLQRRVTMDLTGLPPTVEEVDAFLADKAPDSYEKLVDRLLESKHYGERMAQNWMDLARYADTSGYHFDGVRFMWPWRDWVIEAFNSNKPFDEFSVEQLAGDLLPSPTTPQRVATGFVRNNMTNDEGGADPDEYLSKYVADRVSTLGSVWLGMTVGCAECHDHKYDPLKTKEFYQLYAFFHNVPEKGLDRIRTDNPPPRIPLPTPEQAAAFVEADFRLRDADKTLSDRSGELGEAQEKWEREILPKPPAKPSDDGLIARLEFDGKLEPTPVSTGGRRLVGAEKEEYVPGVFGQALKLDGKTHAEFDNLVSFDRTNAFTIAAWVKSNGDGAIVSKMEKGPGYKGFDLLMTDGRPQFHLISTWPDNALKVQTRDKFPGGQWLHVAVTYDGSGKAGGVKFYVNGRARATDVEKDKLKDLARNAEPLRVGSRAGEALWKGEVDDVRFYDRPLPAEVFPPLVLQGYLPIIARSRGVRTDDERARLASFYKDNYATDYLRAEAALNLARDKKNAFYDSIPSTMIMEEMQPPRDTFVLVRGDFLSKGEKVTADTPAFLPPLGDGPKNRLALARWLMAKEHPLTARVVANRYWSLFFGNGLVRTVNDFGSQGERPSHPELLDWLSSQFRDGGLVKLEGRKGAEQARFETKPWDVKGLVRLLVTSATYRQSAAVSQEKLDRDPSNRWLARAPRLRLEAEFVRDNALAVSGLLNQTIGGPSVKPYQPDGIWDGVDARYERDRGDKIYRRGMYVFWRRSAHYPSFATFDAPNREVCTFLRQRTQTPLQSLVLMNDPVFVEAARALAQRVLKEEPADTRKAILRAFRHTLGRVPTAEELDTLRKTYDAQLESFRQDGKAAEALLAVGDLKRPEGADAAGLAAMTSVANVLLNLNETITK